MAIELTTASKSLLAAIRSSLEVPLELPVPKVSLQSAYTQTNVPYMSCNSTGNTGNEKFYETGSITLETFPVVTVQDMTKEFLKSYQVFIEMVIFKGPKDFYVPNATVKPWAGSYSLTRSGDLGPLSNYGIVRYNHFPVTTLGQVVNLSNYLSNRFIIKPIGYINENNTQQTLNLLTPTKSRGGNANISGRFGYSRKFKPLYIAFRYVTLLPNDNNGRGQIISGPLSPTIRVANSIFPFITDHYKSSVYNRPVVKLNPKFNNATRKVFKCKFC